MNKIHPLNEDRFNQLDQDRIHHHYENDTQQLNKDEIHQSNEKKLVKIRIINLKKSLFNNWIKI